MDLKTLSKNVETIMLGYSKRFNIEQSTQWCLIKLAEEMGELMQSYLKYKGQARIKATDPDDLRKAFEDEIADVICMTILVAQKENIDVKQAIENKWMKHMPAAKELVC